MARPKKIHSKYKKKFAEEIVELGNQGKYIAQVAAHFQVSTNSLRRWRVDSSKPEFIEAWDIYHTNLMAWWVDLGVRGMTGQVKPFLFGQWIYMMKCIFKEEWLSDQKQTVDVTGGGVKGMSDEQLEQLALAKVQERIKMNKLKVVPGGNKTGGNG